MQRNDLKLLIYHIKQYVKKKDMIVSFTFQTENNIKIPHILFLVGLYNPLSKKILDN